eukprot:TRINITY_DN27720_c0_g1_i1.p1 TRINITY_DN27720_c0_g1~~TRINITY_DN27720_c0_g1_i1.p1  ORF type:complete len:468 (+),score=75.38 TRINITY_DN27720_c0_g1_i1:148-1551(+)
MARSVALLRTLFLYLFAPAPLARAQKILFGHSISNPPDVNHLAKTWHLTGTAMPSHRALILSPGVADRIGTIFSRSPLTTNDFEVSFTISAKAGAPGTFVNDGFAFWYVQDNATQLVQGPSEEHTHNQDEIMAGSWQTNYANKGLNLLGFASAYKGFGLFFLNGEGGKTISTKMNDGSLTPLVGNGLPDKNQLKLDYQSGKDMLVNIRIKPEKIEVRIDGDALEVQTMTQPGGYIGFSCYGGSKEQYNPKERSAVIELKGLKVTNYASGEGEAAIEETEKPKAIPAGEKEDVLGSHSSFKSHRDESEAIKELSNMVFKLVVETRPTREQMKASIDSLSKRVQSVERSFQMLQAEIEKKSGHKLNEEFAAIKKDLVQLHSEAHKSHAERGQKLEILHSSIAEVKTSSNAGEISGHLDSLSDSNAKVIDQLTGEHQRMFGFYIGAIAFIVVSGLSLYHKFSCWEKKHVL